MSEQWTELNLVPPTRDDKLRVLLEVIDPLVHGLLSQDISHWFYGHYDSPGPSHLRLRILWQSGTEISRVTGEATSFLQTKQSDGTLVEFYEGSHGRKYQTYTGEADEHEGMWEATYKLWSCQSAYALNLLKLESASALTKHHLPWHWSRSVHMLSNSLLLSYLDEAYLSLKRGQDCLNILEANQTDAPTKDWFTRLAKTVGSAQGRIEMDVKQSLDESIRDLIDDPSSY
jgi:hypothetical protein